MIERFQYRMKFGQTYFFQIILKQWELDLLDIYIYIYTQKFFMWSIIYPLIININIFFIIVRIKQNMEFVRVGLEFIITNEFKYNIGIIIELFYCKIRFVSAGVGVIIIRNFRKDS